MSATAPILLLMSPYVDNRPHNVISRCLLMMFIYVILNVQHAALFAPMWFWCISVFSQSPSGTKSKYFNLPAIRLGDKSQRAVLQKRRLTALTFLVTFKRIKKKSCLGGWFQICIYFSKIVLVLFFPY